MQKITRLLGNLFADPNRAIEDTASAFMKHNKLFQVAADPDGVLMKEKQASQQLADELEGIVKDLGTGVAEQKEGRTLTEAEYKTALSRLRDNHAGLNTSYFPAPAEVRAKLNQLLYSDGMNPYNAATKDSLPGIISTYLSIVQNPANQAPAIFISNSENELGPYAVIRETQTALIQKTDEARARRRKIVPRLEEQMTRNLHSLCFVYPDDRSIVATYYNASLLEDQATAHPGRYLGRVDKMHTNQVVNLAEAARRYVSVSLKVDESRYLLFYRTDDPKGPVPVEALKVSHDTPQTLLLADLLGTGAFLVAHNPHAYVGHYAVQLLA